MNLARATSTPAPVITTMKIRVDMSQGRAVRP